METMHNGHVDRTLRSASRTLCSEPGPQGTRVRLIRHQLEGRSRCRNGAYLRLIRLGALVVIFLLSVLPASACA